MVRGFRKIREASGIEEYLYQKNGLRVLYVHRPGTDTVMSNIVYMVGSRHEAHGKTGLAHMLEHMLFKQTKDRFGKLVPKPRYVALQNKGAELNATTWVDRTNYYFVMPPEYLGDMLQAEAERMRGIILTDKTFKPERQNVLSEYEMGADRPESLVDYALISQLFVSHGYGHQTIGFKSDIESYTCDDLRAFYDTYYWPNNACLMVIGDVTRDDALAAIDREFKHIPRSPKPIPAYAVVEPAPVGVHTVRIERANPVSMMSFGFRSPAATDPGWIQAYLLFAYLASGRLSPLYKKLVESNLASAVSFATAPLHDPEYCTIDITVARGTDMHVIREIVMRAISDLKKKRISNKDLERIKNRMLADIYYSRDGVQSIGHELTELVAAGDWTLYDVLPQRIKDATAEALHTFAQTLFSGPRVEVELQGSKKKI